MNYDDIKDIMIAFVEDKTGINAFKEYGELSDVTNPYFILDIIDEKRYGRDERHEAYDEDDDLILRHTEGQRGFIVSFNCYSSDESNSSAQYVSTLLDALGLESSLEYFNAENIAITSIGKPTTVSFNDDGVLRRITNVDVVFGTAVQTTDSPVDYFETFVMVRN